MATKQTEFDRVYRWKNNPKRVSLNGRICRILATGSSQHAVLIEFEDGERVITHARAVRHHKIRKKPRK